MNIGEIGAVVVFFIGVYGTVARRNITKTIISIGIMEASAILYFIAAAGERAAESPVSGGLGAADPTPQALMITVIVIGIGITATALTMFIYLYHKYGTTNWDKARDMEGVK